MTPPLRQVLVPQQLLYGPETNGLTPASVWTSSWTVQRAVKAAACEQGASGILRRLTSNHNPPEANES